MSRIPVPTDQRLFQAPDARMTVPTTGGGGLGGLGRGLQHAGQALRQFAEQKRAFQREKALFQNDRAADQFLEELGTQTDAIADPNEKRRVFEEGIERFREETLNRIEDADIRDRVTARFEANAAAAGRIVEREALGAERREYAAEVYDQAWESYAAGQPEAAHDLMARAVGVGAIAPGDAAVYLRQLDGQYQQAQFLRAMEADPGTVPELPLDRMDPVGRERLLLAARASAVKYHRSLQTQDFQLALRQQEHRLLDGQVDLAQSQAQVEAALAEIQDLTEPERRALREDALAQLASTQAQGLFLADRFDSESDLEAAIAAIGSLEHLHPEQRLRLTTGLKHELQRRQDAADNLALQEAQDARRRRGASLVHRIQTMDVTGDYVTLDEIWAQAPAFNEDYSEVVREGAISFEDALRAEAAWMNHQRQALSQQVDYAHVAAAAEDPRAILDDTPENRKALNAYLFEGVESFRAYAEAVAEAEEAGEPIPPPTQAMAQDLIRVAGQVGLVPDALISQLRTGLESSQDPDARLAATRLYYDLQRVRGLTPSRIRAQVGARYANQAELMHAALGVSRTTEEASRFVDEALASPGYSDERSGTQNMEQLAQRLLDEESAEQAFQRMLADDASLNSGWMRWIGSLRINQLTYGAASIPLDPLQGARRVLGSLTGSGDGDQTFQAEVVDGMLQSFQNHYVAAMAMWRDPEIAKLNAWDAMAQEWGPTSWGLQPESWDVQARLADFWQPQTYAARLPLEANYASPHNKRDPIGWVRRQMLDDLVERWVPTVEREGQTIANPLYTTLAEASPELAQLLNKASALEKGSDAYLALADELQRHVVPVASEASRPAQRPLYIPSAYVLYGDEAEGIMPWQEDRPLYQLQVADARHHGAPLLLENPDGSGVIHFQPRWEQSEDFQEELRLRQAQLERVRAYHFFQHAAPASRDPGSLTRMDGFFTKRQAMVRDAARREADEELALDGDQAALFRVMRRQQIMDQADLAFRQHYDAIARELEINPHLIGDLTRNHEGMLEESGLPYTSLEQARKRLEAERSRR